MRLFIFNIDYDSYTVNYSTSFPGNIVGEGNSINEVIMLFLEMIKNR